MEKVLFTVRQLLKVIGGGLVGGSLVSQASVTDALTSFEGVVGSIMVAIGVGVSIWNQIKANTGNITGSTGTGVQ